MVIPDLARRNRVITFDPRQRALRSAADRRRLRRSRVRRGRAGGPRRDRHQARGGRRPVHRGAARAHPGGSPSRSDQRACVHRPVDPARRAAAERHIDFDAQLDTDAGWPPQPPLLAARLPRVPRILLQPLLHGAALGRSRPRTPSAGARKRTRRRSSDERQRKPDEAQTRAMCARVSCPTLVVGRRRCRDRPRSWIGPGRRDPRRQHRVDRGWRSHPECARPGQDQPASARLHPGRSRRPNDERRWDADLDARLSRRRRALYISSPIGLGHAQRDVAVAPSCERSSRTSRSTGSPRTGHAGPADERRADPSAERGARLRIRHIASESTEHELNAFQAIRRMDEILINNFMVFHDAIEEGEYDLVIGDEAGMSTTTSTRTRSSSGRPSRG